jgi:predicted PhzF superfamily epimerase YddE/YHI9
MSRVRLPYYQVDAFTSQTFRGNPAGVCILTDWLPDPVLQRIAAENNLSETAFFIRQDGFFHLRWFTPAMEVDLCGHATLAPAFVLFAELGHADEIVRFQTRSGWLSASRHGDLVELDFPARPPLPCAIPDDLVAGLGRKPQAVLRSRDFVAVFESEAEVASITPDFARLARLDCLGTIVTAPGANSDFVSRFFAPRAGVPEDPVTGSSHSSLIPFWAARLGKPELFARQISQRGGELYCRSLGERVAIGGRAVIYSRGELEVPLD